MKFAIALLIAATSTVSAAPVNAQEQLQKDAATKAATAITTYDANQEKDAKTAAKYDAMTAAEKTTWDAARKKLTDARKKRDDDEKTLVGFSSLTLEQQKAYSESLLAFKTAKDKACLASATGFECKHADALRLAKEKKRVTDKYYQKASASDKSDWDTKYKTEDTKLRATLTAADADAKKKADAAEAARLRTTGESCAKPTTGDAPKCAATHCCGSAKIKGATSGALTICNTKAATTYKKGTTSYEFACASSTGAQALVASAAAFLATSYML